MISLLRCSYACRYFLWKGSPNLLFLPTQLVVHLARWRRLWAPHAVLSSFEYLASMFSWQIWSCPSCQFWSLLKTMSFKFCLLKATRGFPHSKFSSSHFAEDFPTLYAMATCPVHMLKGEEIKSGHYLLHSANNISTSSGLWNREGVKKFMNVSSR